MKKLILFLLVLLTGCQAIGEHYQCLAEVDRQIPAQVQQRFIRTDTQCDANTTGFLGGGTTKTPGNVYMGNTTTNCTSTPIYETIVLNKVQRDAAFQQCMSSVRNNRIQQNNQNQVSAYQAASFIPNSNWSTDNLCAYVKRTDVDISPARNEINARHADCHFGYQPPPSYLGNAITVDQAISQCTKDGLTKGTPIFGECVRKYTKQ